MHHTNTLKYSLMFDFDFNLDFNEGKYETQELENKHSIQRNNESNVTSTVWFEKYRPASLEELILTDAFKTKIREWITKQEIPNLLFSGPPGTGKSSTARLLIKYICKSPQDYLVLSTTEERKLDIFREKVGRFLKTKPAASKIKIVLIEEVAATGLGLTKQSMDTLLQYAEGKYIEHTRFILTTNYPHKLPPAVLSRFAHYEFKALPKHYVKERCYRILEQENVQYDKQLVSKVVDILYPNFRTILQALEMLTITTNDGKRILSEELFDHVIPGLLMITPEQLAATIVSFAWEIRKERNLQRILDIVTPDLLQKLVSTKAKDILPLLAPNKDIVDVLQVYTELRQTGKLNPTVADLLAILIEQELS